MQPQRLFILVALFVLATVVAYSGAVTPSNPAKRESKVSFSKQVRPILQANCYGCHQAAKAEGSFQMTSRERLLQGGESGSPAVVPGNAAKSYLLEMITRRRKARRKCRKAVRRWQPATLTSSAAGSAKAPKTTAR